jgi:hypothetical protein
MRVFDVECCAGSGGSAIAAGSMGTIRIVSSASKNSWAVSAAFALVPSCSGSAKSATSRLASFRDDDVGPDVAAAAATGNNAAHLRHPPFRSGI